MQRLVFLVLVLVPLARSATAQVDAQAAYQQAKAAYAAGNFTAARDAAQKAAQTDPKNPEVFLLLGRAQYQLGAIDDAVTAWKKTLELAPQEPFAAQMLAALQGRRTDIDARIKLLEVDVQQNLLAAAQGEAGKLLNEKALSESQRARVLLLEAEALLEENKPAEALSVLNEAATLYPNQADPVQRALLIGKARLRQNTPDSLAEGTALLEKLVAEQPKSPQAATAQLELLSVALNQGVAAPRLEALAQWIAANPTHRQAREAKRRLLFGYLTATTQGPRPTAASDLAATDVQALALAAEVLKESPWDQPAQQVATRLLEHLENHYGKNGASAAAAKGTAALLAAPLPRSSRLAVLRAAMVYRQQVAVAWLQNEARAGRLPAAAKEGALPPPLAETLVARQALRTEFPDMALWGEQVALAETVRQYAAKVAWPPVVAALRGPDAWALDILRPVVASTDNEASAKAAELAAGIAADYQALDSRPAKDLALSITRGLLDAAKTDAAFLLLAAKHAELLYSYSAYLFNENIKAGNDAANAKLSDLQKELIATAVRELGRNADLWQATLANLQKHLEPWIARGHWGVAQDMLAGLAPALPEPGRWAAELQSLQWAVTQVKQEHQRMAVVGLTVPRQLDPRLQKVLLRAYALQAGLEANSPRLAQVRAIGEGIAAHYKALEYDDVAEAALQVKPEKPEGAVAAADEHAAFQLLVLQDDRARREALRLWKQYGGAEKVAVTPAFRAVIDAYAKFAADRPDSSFIPQVGDRLLAIAAFFEQQGSPHTAADLYGEIAKFAAGVKVLSQGGPAAPSLADRAAFQRAAALDTHARQLLAKAQADRKPDTPPPAAISKEFAAAIAAYVEFAEGRGDRPLVADAVSRVMAIAAEYAKLDAWDVAEGVFADLAKSKLAIRRPERLEFARGVCRLGPVLPDHARQVLQVLTSGGLGGEAGGVTMLAGGDRGPNASDSRSYRPGSGSGGLGGMGPTGGAVPATQPATPPVSTTAAVPKPAADSAPGDKPQEMADSSGEADEQQPAAEAKRDTQLLAVIRQQEASRATQVAQLRESRVKVVANNEQQGQQQARVEAPVLSAAELARQEKALAAAYEIFQGLRKTRPDTAIAEQARAEILVMVAHWRALAQWQRAAALAQRFLTDNATDIDLPKLRLEIARDLLAWASRPPEGTLSRQAMLTEVATRFRAARAELEKVVAEFPKEKALAQEAQWDIATSFLSEARAIAGVSPTLARGQYVRAARELRQVALKHPSHPQMPNIAQNLWNIAQELQGRGFDDEAILVWNELITFDPLNAQAQEAVLRIAQTYQKLRRPLKAAETYQELNFVRGGNDQALQDSIFQIGTTLKNEKRWVEALHVLENFADAFPRHPQAGAALAMVGQIHQTNEAWQDAIAAYRRVIAEFKEGQFVQEAKWAIAECTINLSQWKEAAQAYRDYVAAYPQDGKVAEANRRIEVLKDLVRYQGLVDEQGQRKSFDAQFQIATIVRQQLANPVKAIIEFRKVAANWPESHLADDALYEVGSIYLSLGETQKAREALLLVGQKYPSSPLADDALFLVGKSYEEEADKLAALTREKTVERAHDTAQKYAYQQAQSNRRAQQDVGRGRVAELKKAGKGEAAEREEASQAANYNTFNDANVELFAQQAGQRVEELTAGQLADRQDKIDAALRRAVESYTAASKVAGADKAGDALLQMATIYDQRLKDSKAAMETWLEIVRQFSGTAVAEDASWKIAQYYEREGKFAEAVEAYNAFLRNYRRSPNAGQAQFSVAENYERLGQWVAAMDAYSKYLTNFAEGPLAAKAKEQINWIKTYRL